MQRRGALTILLSGVLLMAARADADPAGPPFATEVWTSGEGGYHTYRIPSLLVAPDGTLLAFCEGRCGGLGDAGDIDLLLKRSADGGRTWSAAQVLWDDGPNTCGNPCPVVDHVTGTIWLLLTWNRGDDTEPEIADGTATDTRRVFVTHSTDNGQTWGPPWDITPQAKQPTWRWYATGPGVGIQLRQGPHAGRLVIPCDHSDPGYDDLRGFGAHMLYSDDHGATWAISEPIVPAVNECQVVELADGRLLCNLRNYAPAPHNHQRAVAISDDGGATWSAVGYDPTLIEPICQACLIRHGQGLPAGPLSEALLFSNPASTDRRERMTVRLSRDDGATWPLELLVNPAASAYSCLATLPDGRVALLYEAAEYAQLRLIVFGLDQLTAPRQD